MIPYCLCTWTDFLGTEYQPPNPFLKSNIFLNRPKFYYAGCCCNKGSIILKYRYVYGSWDLCYIQNVSCSINILSRLFIHTRPASTNIVFSACNKIYQHPMAMPPPLQIKTTSNSGNCQKSQQRWSVRNDSWAYANHHPNYQRAHFLLLLQCITALMSMIVRSHSHKGVISIMYMQQPV